MSATTTHAIVPEAGDALLIVDVQNDFLTGGSLAVPNGDAVIPVLNGWIRRFRTAGLSVFATRDWHPPCHCSFRDQGGLWPPHCVAGTKGAEFCAELTLPPKTTVISKGTKPEKDAYSGFDETDLAHRLREANIDRIFVGGLATDYCVRATVLDAVAEGFRVVLLLDAVRAVDAQPADGERAREAMLAAGALAVSREV